MAQHPPRCQWRHHDREVQGARERQRDGQGEKQRLVQQDGRLGPKRPRPERLHKHRGAPGARYARRQDGVPADGLQELGSGVGQLREEGRHHHLHLHREKHRLGEGALHAHTRLRADGHYVCERRGRRGFRLDGRLRRVGAERHRGQQREVRELHRDGEPRRPDLYRGHGALRHAERGPGRARQDR